MIGRPNKFDVLFQTFICQDVIDMIEAAKEKVELPDRILIIDRNGFKEKPQIPGKLLSQLLGGQEKMI